MGAKTRHGPKIQAKTARLGKFSDWYHPACVINDDRVDLLFFKAAVAPYANHMPLMEGEKDKLDTILGDFWLKNAPWCILER